MVIKTARYRKARGMRAHAKHPLRYQEYKEGRVSYYSIPLRIIPLRRSAMLSAD